MNGTYDQMQQIRVCTYDGPGAQPVIRTVDWPKLPKSAALIKVGACGVCGTDLHILKGHWPRPLPWPFTLGHEIGGVAFDVGNWAIECCCRPQRAALAHRPDIPALSPTFSNQAGLGPARDPSLTLRWTP